eukprot:2048451-Ditylum_brightwellii.AAC.1
MFFSANSKVKTCDDLSDGSLSRGVKKPPSLKGIDKFVNKNNPPPHKTEATMESPPTAHK